MPTMMPMLPSSRPAWISRRYLQPPSGRCALLTGSSTVRERREIHAGLEDGSVGIIVGTHALLEDDVRFKALGLAIIDEQHRFGVEQRSKLWAKGPALPIAAQAATLVQVRGFAPHPPQAGAWVPPSNDAEGGTPGEGSTPAPQQAAANVSAKAPVRGSGRPAIPLEGV